MKRGERHDMPPYVRGRRAVLVHLGFSAMVVHLLILGLQVANQLRRPGVVLSPSWWWFALAFVPIVMALPIVVVSERRLLKRLKGCGYAACLYCSYPLAHLKEPGRCPECGRENDPAEAARRWKTVGSLFG